MIIEVLFSEVASLFRDDFNMRYLSECLPGSELVYTDLFSEPRFVSGKADVVYLGPMSDKYQPLVLEQLMPYKARIAELVEGGTVFLATGNALELFGQSVGDKPALGVFGYHAVHHPERFDRSCLLGTFAPEDGEAMRIVGFKGQFSDIEGNDHPWIQVDKGVGQPDDRAHEGVHYKNFFGTYLMGPVLILNPPLARYVTQALGHDEPVAFEDAVMRAYDARVAEFERKDIGVYVHM